MGMKHIICLAKRSLTFSVIALPLMASCSSPNVEDAKPVALAKPSGESVEWLTDLEQAKRVAASEGKDLFVNFTGLSWCGPCMELEREVLTTAEFAPAADHFVLVRLDYDPGVHRLPQEPPEPHVPWREYYGINAFPTVILADAAGQPFAMTGNNGLKAREFLSHVQELRAVRGRRDAAFALAKKAENNLEKAELLAEGLSALRVALRVSDSGVNADPLVRFYREDIDAVVQLDPDDDAGLGGQFEGIVQAEQQRGDVQVFYDLLGTTYKEQGIDATLQLLDERIAAIDSTELRNSFRQSRRTFLEWSDRHEEALALSRELAADESISEELRFHSRERIAFNLWRLNRLEEALTQLDTLIVEAKDNPRRRFSLLWTKATQLWDSERFEDALATWEQAIPLSEPNTEDWRNGNWHRLRLLARMGRVDDAWAAYDEAAASGFYRPLELAGWCVHIAINLNQHGSREAALEAAARGATALADVEANMPDDGEVIVRFRQLLEKIQADSPQSLEGQGPNSNTGGKDK